MSTSGKDWVLTLDHLAQQLVDHLLDEAAALKYGQPGDEVADGIGRVH